MSALALQNFGFEDQLVRVLVRADMPWFVTQDVCACLELGNHSQAIKSLDEDEKGVTTNDTLGGMQQISIVSESGLYSLIFKSRKPIAKQFRKWVTSVVLPAIRQTGRFELPQAHNDLPDPVDPIDSVEKVRAALQMVREARITFGNKAAQRAWTLSGLPDVTGQSAQPSQIAKIAEIPNWQNVADWFEVRIEPQHGHRVSATDLHVDYLKYCRDNGIKGDSMRTFGGALRGMGCEFVLSNGTKYLNIRLKD